MAPTTTNTSTTSGAKKSNETTLTNLTKRFVKLVDSSSERVINLNEASARLGVMKRRIYDVTNVLEGVGLLRKTSKNVTQWIDCPADSPLAAPSNAVSNNTTALSSLTTTNTMDTIDLNQQATAGLQPDDELLALEQTYKSLEEAVISLEAKIRQQQSADDAFVTYNDIKSSFNHQVVIAVKAPPETKLVVYEDLRILFKSENGEIEVYLCPQNETNSNNYENTIQQQQQQQIQYYPTSSVSNDDQYYNSDPTLSSTLSGTISEDDEEDPFKPLVPYEEQNYNFMLDENYTLSSLFPGDNLGLY